MPHLPQIGDLSFKLSKSPTPQRSPWVRSLTLLPNISIMATCLAAAAYSPMPRLLFSTRHESVALEQDWQQIQDKPPVVWARCSDFSKLMLNVCLLHKVRFTVCMCRKQIQPPQAHPADKVAQTYPPSPTYGRWGIAMIGALQDSFYTGIQLS